MKSKDDIERECCPQDRVNECVNLDQLARELNAIALDLVVDLASLPTFGGPDVKNTKEVFSWDATRILVAGNGWIIEERCQTCGEATFHCKHDN